MDPRFMPGAVFEWMALIPSVGIMYLLAGHLLALARLRAWDTPGDTWVKTLIAPITSFEQDYPKIVNRSVYYVAVTLFWPGVLLWNALTLCFLMLLCVPVIVFLAKVDALTNLIKRTVGLRLKLAARRVTRFVAADSRTRRKIERLETRRYRLRSYISRERAQIALLEERITALSNSLPAPETGTGPFRSATVRVLPTRVSPPAPRKSREAKPHPELDKIDRRLDDLSAGRADVPVVKAAGKGHWIITN